MRLEMDRLIIRPYEAGDLDNFHEIFSDPVVMHHCEAPYGRTASQKWLSFFIEKPIAYAVVLKNTDNMIGHALFKQLPGEEAGIYEIGWIYNRRFWRQGYAYETARKLMDHGFSTLQLHKICAETIDPLASVPLKKKLGMQEEGVFRQHTLSPDGIWADLYWYAALGSEWKN